MNITNISGLEKHLLRIHFNSWHCITKLLSAIRIIFHSTSVIWQTVGKPRTEVKRNPGSAISRFFNATPNMLSQFHETPVSFWSQIKIAIVGETVVGEVIIPGVNYLISSCTVTYTILQLQTHGAHALPCSFSGALQGLLVVLGHVQFYGNVVGIFTEIWPLIVQSKSRIIVLELITNSARLKTAGKAPPWKVHKPEWFFEIFNYNKQKHSVNRIQCTVWQKHTTCFAFKYYLYMKWLRAW